MRIGLATITFLFLVLFAFQGAHAFSHNIKKYCRKKAQGSVQMYVKCMKGEKEAKDKVRKIKRKLKFAAKKYCEEKASSYSDYYSCLKEQKEAFEAFKDAKVKPPARVKRFCREKSKGNWANYVYCLIRETEAYEEMKRSFTY